jgi:hypothetical protein
MTSPRAEFSYIYSATKEQITLLTGASEDLLHLHAGLLIFVGTALLLRKRMQSWLPISLVAFFAILNELGDEAAGRSNSVSEHIVDIINTLSWPAILFVLARRWPHREPKPTPEQRS